MQTAEHHREQFELAYATAWAKDRDDGETPEQLAAEIKAWRVGDTYEAEFIRLRFGWEGYQWARAGQCLAQIEEPAGAAPAAVSGPTAVELQMLAAKHTRSVAAPTGYVCDAVAAVKEALARWGAAPALEAPAASTMAAEFTDQSIADPVEKARRYLKAMADEAPNSVYFFDDGYPRRASSQDAKATLVVLEQLAGHAAPALEVPAAPAGKPMAVTPEMRAAFRRAYREGGFWNDRLDYALDQMLAAAPQAPAGLDELRKISEIAACWGCDHPDEPGDTEVVRRVKWAARQLRAVSQAPAAPAEPVYQISQPYHTDPKNTWRDASEAAYDVSVPARRRVLFTGPAAPAAPAVDAAAPIDGCTDPYNCARCKTHPAHRGDMHHAGISQPRSAAPAKEGGEA